MIYVIIGQAGIGKTTFVKNEFIKNNEFEIIEDDIVPYTKCDHMVLIGRYGIDIRTEGTDTLSYSILPKIKKFIERNYYVYDIVMEGDRINNDSMFNWVLEKGYCCHIHLMYGSLKFSKQRLEKTDSKITIKFIKATRTKSLNNYKKYGPLFGGNAVCMK